MKVRFLKDQAICNDGIKIIRKKRGDILSYPGEIDKSLLKPLKELGIIEKIEEEEKVEEKEIKEEVKEDEEIIDIDEDEEVEEAEEDITKKTIFQKHNKKKRR